MSSSLYFPLNNEHRQLPYNDMSESLISSILCGNLTRKLSSIFYFHNPGQRQSAVLSNVQLSVQSLKCQTAPGDLSCYKNIPESKYFHASVRFHLTSYL